MNDETLLDLMMESVDHRYGGVEREDFARALATIRPYLKRESGGLDEIAKAMWGGKVPARWNEMTISNKVESIIARYNQPIGDMG